MKYIKKFSEISTANTASVGGKGASLGEMMQAGIPVPDGYVVVADAFDYFLAETDLTQEIAAILQTVDTNIIHTVEAASEKIQHLIKSAVMPEDVAVEILRQFKLLGTDYVAVRSSATAEDGAENAWAGQLSSYLNTTENELLNKVQRCWSSLFTPRAIFYRFENKLENTDISVAVVVQKMVDSEKSGIAFSVHPITEDYNQIIIEAGLGLGEAIVSGAVTPDSYVLTKEPQKIIDINVNEQNKALFRSGSLSEEGWSEWRELSSQEANTQVLSSDEILELGTIVMKIESHYGFPCDIEWAFENGSFYITQSRPITTLNNRSSFAGKDKKLVYTKTLERDTTLIMQGVFVSVMENELNQTLGISPFKGPSYWYVTNSENVAFYENQDFIDDLIRQIGTRAGSENFLQEVERIYTEAVSKVMPYWKKGYADNLQELQQYLNDSRNFIMCVAVSFYGGMVSDLEDRAQKLFLKIRSEYDFFATADEYVRETLEKLGVHRHLANLVALSEFDNLPTNENLEERRISGSVFASGRLTLLDSGKHIQDLFPDYIFKETVVPDLAVDVVGQVANSGLATGIVRIVKSRADISKVESGDIIVSPMTTPDFLPAMKKASAFVTDEGGVTCHAAIVARELNKPCIIGTKYATKLLKDGDTVMVDANNGIVKIVS